MGRQTGVIALVGLVLFGAAGADSVEADAILRSDVASAMKRATDYYRTQVATHGGYVYYYSLELQQRWGEGVATADQIWVQPPGTPTVGLAYLAAYEATGDRFYLNAATEAAEALVYGQLESGGWTNVIDFNPHSKRAGRYLRHPESGGDRNASTLDDGITQAALRLLVHVDRAHGFERDDIHEAAAIGLEALLKAQFPSGGFPQVWDDDPIRQPPPEQANYPDYDWRTEGRIKNYWDMATLNDGSAGTVAEVLIDAYEVYHEQRYKTALARLGDFLLRAQMPEPQPAWAQQYNDRMQPIWARRFEPAAIASRESQDVLETLMTIYRHTGDEKYLEPIPRALAYLKRSLLPDGQLARFYELRTNKALYMTRHGREYSLTYDDSRLPKHYGWKEASRLEEIGREFEALKSIGRSEPVSGQESGNAHSPTGPLAHSPDEVRRILHDLDDQGRWISTYTGQRLVGQPKFPKGSRYLSSGVFSRNLEVLSDYLQSTRVGLGLLRWSLGNDDQARGKRCGR